MKVNKNYTFFNISYESPWEINIKYKEFYNWLLESCNNDKENVEAKELFYLVNSYDKLKDHIKVKQNSDEYLMKLLRLSVESKVKLSDYLVKSKDEYLFLNKLSMGEKDYNFYTHLLSWYSLTIDTTDKVVKRLYKVSVKMNMQGCPPQDCHYMEWTEEKNNQIYNLK